MKPKSLRLELPGEIHELLLKLQLVLRDEMGLTNVSQTSTIHIAIRSFAKSKGIEIETPASN